jgi:hypothetical protein
VGARYTLTAQLNARNDAYQVALFDRRRPLADPRQSALDKALRDLAPLLDTQRPEQWRGVNLAAVGDAIFALLFGDGAVLSTALSELTGRTQADLRPTRYGLRLKVVTADPLLSGLPWRLIRGGGYWLTTGALPWTIEVCPTVAPTPSVQLRAPAKVLIIAPPAPGLGTASHVAMLREVLLERAGIDDSYVQVVTDRRGVERALTGMEPSIIYAFCHGTGDGGLALSDGPISAAELRAKLPRAMPPKALYVNACGTGAGGWTAAGHQLVDRVPLVIANRTLVKPADASARALSWFSAVLGDGADPVQALHRLDARQSLEDPAWWTPVVHAAYDVWDTEKSRSARRWPSVARRLDRLNQRGLAFARLDRLVTGERRRVDAWVGMGPPGRRVDQLAPHLADYLEVAAAHLVQLDVPHAVDFPDDRRWLAEDLEDAVIAALDADGEPLEYALNRIAQTRIRPGCLPLLWLDFGSFGKGAPDRLKPALNGAALRDWLAWCDDALAPRCPPSLRIVCVLTVETDRPERVESVVLDYRAAHAQERFNCYPLPALSAVPLNELLDFFTDADNTSCPPSLATEVARAIHQAAEDYDDLIRLIEEGQSQGWSRLLRSLRPQVAPVEDDDAF